MLKRWVHGAACAARSYNARAPTARAWAAEVRGVGRSDARGGLRRDTGGSSAMATTPQSAGSAELRVQVHPRAMVAADTELRGRITVGAGTVVHPRARIDASRGAIVLGDNCLVEERACLVSGDRGMRIGDGNVFRVACHVASPHIGNCNVLEAGCRVPDTVSLGHFCVIGAGCQVPRDYGDQQPHGDSEVTLRERTVIYGRDADEHTWSGHGIGQQLALHAKHLQYLRDTLPTTHKLRLIHHEQAPMESS